MAIEVMAAFGCLRLHVGAEQLSLVVRSRALAPGNGCRFRGRDAGAALNAGVSLLDEEPTTRGFPSGVGRRLAAQLVPQAAPDSSSSS